MKTPSVIRLAIRASFLSCFFFTAGCHKDLPVSDADNTGSSVRIFLTDDPSLTAEHLFLDLRKLEIKVEDNDSADDHGHHEGENDRTSDDSHGADDGSRHDLDDDHDSDTSGGWRAVAIQPGVYDLLRFRNGLDTLLGTGSFSSGLRLKRIRLTLGQDNSAVVNGNSVALDLTDRDRFLVIDVDEDRVEIKSGDRTEIWLDIDAGLSLQQHGDRLELKPSGKAFSKTKNGSIEGSVLPAAARPVILAINGTDTATARAEDGGGFKLIGLKAATYTVVYRARSGSFQDAVMTGVVISGKEDVHLPPVTLHP